jgi:hypothetical protein
MGLFALITPYHTTIIQYLPEKGERQATPSIIRHS